MRFLMFACLTVLCANPMLHGEAPPAARYEGHKLVRVTLRSPEDVAVMLSISQDHWSETIGPGTWPFRVAPEDLEKLAATGLEFEIVHQDIQDLIDRSDPARVAAGFSWFDNYKSYAQVNAYMDSLAAQFPALVTKITVGQSLEGRTIYGLRISAAASGGEVLYTGCQHAREWISVMVNMYIADRLARTYATDPGVQALLDQLVFYIVPIVNPDGYVYTWDPGGDRLWRKNRRNNGGGSFGVDTNRNWSAGWGNPEGSSGNPNSETYRGTAPFSEPETQALRDFVLSHPQLVVHIDFHSFSQLVLSPYGYVIGSPPPPHGGLYDQLNAAMASAIAGVHGMQYEAGPAAQTLYIAAGTFPDWSDEQGTFGWTIEVRDTGQTGFLLPPEQILPTAEENFEAAMVVAEFASDALVMVPGETPAYVEAGVAETVGLHIVPLSSTVAPGGAILHHRIGTAGPFQQQQMTAAGNDLYSADLPAAPCTSTIQYYFEAEAADGRTVAAPAGAPAALFETVALSPIEVLADDMEQDTGWTVGGPGDNATTGAWVRVAPNGTAAQPGSDHTPSGTMCWVTGQGPVGGGVGDNDVDGGQTTLLSPLLNLAGSDAVISYWRWYSNDQGAAPNSDVLQVAISNNNGFTWVPVETVGPAGPQAAGGWYHHELTVSDFVTPTATVRMRFVAADDPPGSIIEAAIDDFNAAILTCAPQAPAVDAAGSRYLEVGSLAVPPGTSIALRVSSPDFPCLEQYVNATGGLQASPVFQPAEAWSGLLISGAVILPGQVYHVQADTGTPLQPLLSPAAVVATWEAGDTDHSGDVDLLDLTCVLDGFAGSFTACAAPAVDLGGCEPDGLIDLVDLLAVLDAYQGSEAGCPVPCR